MASSPPPPQRLLCLGLVLLLGASWGSALDLHTSQDGMQLTNGGCKGASEWAQRSIYFLLTDRFAAGDGQSVNCDGNTDSRSMYCGGTWKGVQDKLDYIKGMGFDAIWITPIQEQFADQTGSYHGYWAKSWFTVNQRFGTEDDFKNLVSAAQDKGMWVMLDLALNHMAEIEDGRIPQLQPFNQGKYFHGCPQDCDSNCNIRSNCYTILPGTCSLECGLTVENCRLANLRDINQDDPYVQNQTEELIKYLTSRYNINGLRLDAIKHMPKWYLANHVTSKTDCFTIGEGLFGSKDGQTDKTVEAECLQSRYQEEKAVDGVLDFVMQYTLIEAFRNYGKMSKIPQTLRIQKSRVGTGANLSVNGLFIDNHDNVAGGCRWLAQSPNTARFQNALTYIFTGTGIPILYYGTEQKFSGNGGGNDAYCREPLWKSGYNKEAEYYKYVAKLNKYRSACSIWAYEQESLREWDDLYAFRRGDMFVFLTNSDRFIDVEVPAGLLPAGAKLCNIFDPDGPGDQGDCAYVQNGVFKTTVQSYPKIFVPVSHPPSSCGVNPFGAAGLAAAQ